MNARRVRQAAAVAKGRDKILQAWHEALKARGTATKDQATGTFLAGLARSGKAISRGTLYGWEQRRLAAGMQGLVDGRRLPREPEPWDANRPKVLTFYLPGVCLKVQIAAALIDIRERLEGLVISIRRLAAEANMEAQKPGEKGSSKAV
jgi:hypothetical protein